MILNNTIAEETAAELLEISAIKLQPSSPFTWASGWKSPIYCDNRTVLSFPNVRNFLRDQIILTIKELYNTPDVIAGVATGAIAIGVLVAQELNIPFVYVRPEPKKHGRQNQIEGVLKDGQKVVVIEDLISTGKSSLQAVEALKNANANVLGMVAIFSYGFKISDENFKKSNITLHTLSDYNNLLNKAIEKNYIKKEDLETLKKWRENPAEWQ